MKESNIIFYCLNSISLVITGFILLISIYQKIYRILLSQFLMYILISEVLNMAVKYLSFTRNSCFDKEITNDCRTPDLPANIQLIIEIFSEMWTITSALVIALKINDSFRPQFQVFKQKWVQRMSQIGVVVFSLGVALAIGLYQVLFYQKEYPDRNIYTGRCLVMNCHLANSLVITQVSIMLLLIISLSTISVINYSYIKQETKKLSLNLDVVLNQIQTLNQIKRALKKIMILPTFTFCIYILLYLDRIVKVIITPTNVEISKYKLYLYLGYAFGITNGLKGILFSIIILFIVTDLKDSLFSCFKKTKESDSTQHDDIDMSFND